MKFIAIVLVFVMTFGGVIVAAGLEGGIHLVTGVMLPAMPAEVMIIIGVAIAAFLIANPVSLVKQTLNAFKCLSKPAAHDKNSYIEMLSLLFTLFKLARTKGWLALEQHIEQPEDSDLFGQFPSVKQNHHALVFLCDYLRIISLGNDNPHEIEALMDEEIETIAHHEQQPGHAMQTMADGLPALGIVAAVLGVIKTMASIDQPPEVLGKLIGSALVGTFLGVWAGYGFAGPFAGAMLTRAETEIMYYKCMKAGIIAFLNGAAPQVAVEFSRKLLPHDVQPTFIELEDKLNELPTPGAS
ncbi:MAG: flagellar motor stator protein MotA [Alphaproteobacteria bacterium]|nr:flagellar motor stator protein MotA [Alphaproteobacteria bacterium]